MDRIDRPEKRQITDAATGVFATDISDLPPFEKTVWLSSPTMHGDELTYMTQAFRDNWRAKDNRDNH